MSIDVYINFNGNCREAVEFYAEAFGAKLQQIMTFGQAPSDPGAPLPEETKNLIMHTFLIIGDSRVMFSDTYPGMPYVAGNNINLTFMSKNKDEIKTAFQKLKEGGTVNMELQETFWSQCYGSLTDKFGIQWQLSLENY